MLSPRQSYALTLWKRNFDSVDVGLCGRLCGTLLPPMWDFVLVDVGHDWRKSVTSYLDSPQPPIYKGFAAR